MNPDPKKPIPSTEQPASQPDPALKHEREQREPRTSTMTEEAPAEKSPTPEV